MHIPDGFLDTKTWAGLNIASLAMLTIAIIKSKNTMEDKKIPLAGVTAAFIFAAQMLNFPVASGTSGHFMGGFLAALLLGPWTGFLIMSCVLIVQCLVFQDGGLLSLGANIFNMGFMGSVVSYYFYCAFRYILPKKMESILIFTVSWLSIVLAALLCAWELSFAGIMPLKPALLGMGSVHALIGIGEGLATIAVVSYLKMVRKDVLELAKV